MNGHNVDNLVQFEQAALAAEATAQTQFSGPAVAELRLNRLLRELENTDIADFMSVGKWVNFKEDDVVSNQGQPVNDVLFIVSGRARAEVVGNGESTFKAVVKFPGAGDDVGLLSLVDGAPHSATVTALEEIHALSVPMSAMRSRLKGRSEWYRPLAEIAVERMRTSGLWLQALI